jgi:hypothetical protein
LNLEWSEELRAEALRRGDLVEVRSAAEILATLDEGGALGALPFMPEMVQWCGRRLRVDKRADKVCDTIHYWGSRRLNDSVLLEDLRCDGAGHGGCQAECRLFWKEAWLRRVSAADPVRPEGDAAARERLMELAQRSASRETQSNGSPATHWRCQATDLLAASEVLRTWDLRPYFQELASGNVPAGRFVRVMARAAVEEPLRKLKVLSPVQVRGHGSSSPRERSLLDLRPGDWVEVKSREEIEATLTDKGKNRGLWFDREMLAFCGKKYRVRRRIERLIEEPTGRMIELKGDCVTLEGAVCSGDASLGRWFCPRAIYHYWRECWLRRAEPPSAGPAAAAPGT